LKDVRHARSIEGVDWGLTYQRGRSGSFEYPGLTAQKELALFIRTAAYVRWQNKELIETLESVRDLLRIASAVDQQGSIVPRLISLQAQVMAVETALIVSQRTVEGVPQTGSPSPKLTPSEIAAIQAVIADFLNESRRPAAIARAWRGERVYQADQALGFAVRARWFEMRGRSVLMDSVPEFMHMCDQIMAANGESNWPAAQAKMPARARASQASISLAQMTLPSLIAASRREYRALADRRAAAVALALRLYSADHAGQLPQSLSELSPKYLPAVPLDPFSGKGLELAWKKTPSPLIYSVGENGLDDGADETKALNGEVYLRWNSPDAVYHLVRGNN
jgi:hypothetical protein